MLFKPLRLPRYECKRIKYSLFHFSIVLLYQNRYITCMSKENKPPFNLHVSFYCSDAGTEPVREWLQGLTIEMKKKIGEDIKTVQFGWPIGMPVVRKMEKNLWEVRTKFDGGIARVLFTVVDDIMVLLHGFIRSLKKHQRMI